MPALQRADGVRFVLRSYRETVTPKKPSLLRKELFLMSQTHGHYARFIRQLDGRIEAIFSRETDYLLGETVWEYFGRPNDLIYCEVLPGEQDAILVVARNGSIYLDAKLAFNELFDELESLFSTNAQYAIYVAGEVPLARKQTENKFYVAPDWIKTFESFEHSVFEALPVLSQYQLLAFDIAISELKLDAPMLKLIKVGTLVLLLLAIWYWLMPAKQETSILETTTPYEQYSSALNNPEPALQLMELARQIVLLETLPGWLPASIDYTPAGVKVKVHTLGSPTELLLRWAAKYQGRVDFGQGGASLLLPSRLNNRNNIPPVSSLVKSLSTIIDKMMQIIPGKSVAITSTQSQAAYKATNITINFSQGSPVVLTLIGRALEGLPIVLVSSNLTITNGLLSGTIQLTVLGN